MAPARRPSNNGRSPLVNQQRQITSFFSKSTSTPSPLLSKQSPKSNSKRSPSSSPSPSPTTPSPIEIKRKKPVMVIGASSSSPPSPSRENTEKKLYAEVVVNRRIKVYWPLDQSWYEGCVKSFDKMSGKHLVQYDDAEEELLDLAKEKIEWIGEVTNRFRRLRRVSMIEEEDAEVANAGQESGCDDDSADEDWGKNAEPEAPEDLSDDIHLEEEDDEDGGLCGKSSESRKRKKSDGNKLGSSKKSKRNGNVKKTTFKAPLDGNGGKMIQSKGNSGK